MLSILTEGLLKREMRRDSRARPPGFASLLSHWELCRAGQATEPLRRMRAEEPHLGVQLEGMPASRISTGQALLWLGVGAQAMPAKGIIVHASLRR